jgi:hypothetical protein
MAANPLPTFDLEWFPDAWLVFTYIGRGSSRPESEANPFRPRSCKTMSENEINSLQDIASHHKAKSKNIRRAIRTGLLPTSSSDVIDLSESNLNDSMKPLKTNIVISLEKGKSFIASSKMEEVNDQQRVIQMYKDLKIAGQPVTEEEIRAEEFKLLVLLRSRNEIKSAPEIRNSTIDDQRYSRKRSAEDDPVDPSTPNSDQFLEETNLATIFDEINDATHIDQQSVDSLESVYHRCNNRSPSPAIEEI